jgi:hypothetical protein
MESNERYYQRRAVEESRAAARALTPEARERRRALADMFATKAAQSPQGFSRARSLVPVSEVGADAGG